MGQGQAVAPIDGAPDVAKKKSQSGSENRQFTKLVRMDEELVDLAKTVVSLMTKEEKDADGSNVAALFCKVLWPVIKERHDRLILRAADKVEKPRKGKPQK